MGRVGLTPVTPTPPIKYCGLPIACVNRGAYCDLGLDEVGSYVLILPRTPRRSVSVAGRNRLPDVHRAQAVLFHIPEGSRLRHRHPRVFLCQCDKPH